MSGYPTYQALNPSPRKTCWRRMLKFLSAVTTMDNFEQVRRAVNGSVELWRLGKQQQALKLLNDAIADSIRDKAGRSVCTLCHHAAVLCQSAGAVGMVKHYYEQSLTHSPENPRALYGLAKVALEQGNADLAEAYAKRSYAATVQEDDEIAKHGLLDLIALHWPEIGAQ